MDNLQMLLSFLGGFIGSMVTLQLSCFIYPIIDYLQHKTMMSNLSKLSRLQILNCIVITVGVAAAVWGLLLEMPTPSSAAHHGGCNRWSLAAADQIDTFIPGRAVNWGQYSSP